MRTRFARWLTAALCLVILLGMLPLGVHGAAASGGISVQSVAEDNRLKSYDQFLAYYYQTFSLLELLMEDGSSPCKTIVDNADEDLDEALAVWRKATMDVGDQATYSEKEIEFYEFLIFDILYQKNAQDTGLKEVQTAVNALQSDILNDCANLGFDLTLETEVTEENADALLNQLIQYDNLKFLSGMVESVKKGLGYVQDAGELIEKLYILMVMDNCSEVVHDVLDQLYQKATDGAMKEACRRVSLLSTGLLTEGEILAVFAGNVAKQKVTSYVCEKIWDSIVSSTKLGVAAGIGKKVGKLCCNTLFGTDAVMENWYSMKQLNTFETVMKSVLKTYQSQYNSNPTYANAQLFNKAADMYMHVHSVDAAYALKYVEAAQGGGFFGWIYKNITHKEEFEAITADLTSIKLNVDLGIDFANNNTYNFYLDELEACASVVPSWQPTPTITTREEVDQKTEELPELIFRTSNQSTSTSVTYTDDKLTYANYTHSGGTLKLDGNTLTVYGDLYLTGGTIDLWTGTLDVRGNVYQTGGSMLINKGRLEIGGDYRIQSMSTDAWGVTTYGSSNGILRMQYEEDTVTVGGSFITQSLAYTGTYDTYNLFSAGTMEIGGDFIQISTSSNSSSPYNFNSTGTHKVVLNGSGSQNVSFQNYQSGFNYLEMDEAADVTFQNYLRVNAMQSNGTAKSDGLKLYDFAINGKTMSITGDVRISGAVDLRTGQLNIDGNVLQTNGSVALNKGKLNITGDYRIQTKSTDEWGVVSYDGSNGILRMQYAEDTVTVGGSFITQSLAYTGTYDTYNLFSAGTMEIGGDFIQISTSSNSSSPYNFNSTGTHKVVLNGSGSQNVSFQNYQSGFNYLEMDEAADVTFKNYLRVNAMQSNGTAKSDGLNLYDFAINGKTMSITGDVRISGAVDLRTGQLNIDGNVLQTNGSVALNKGKLNITGDYRIQTKSTDEWGVVSYDGSNGILRMQYAEDTVTVGGSFITQSLANTGPYSAYNLFSAGTMEVSGDFIQISTSSNSNSPYNFNSTGTHKVVLNGSGSQNVSFQNYQSGFNYLKMDEAADVTFKNYLRVNAMQSNGNAKSSGLDLYDFNINGKTVSITGDMSISGAVDLKLGELNIDGSLLQTNGSVMLNKGKLNITGDYRIQTKSTDEWGVVSYGSSGGNLRMQYAEDTVTIGGSFVTQSSDATGTGTDYNAFSAGTMTVAGDFKQIKTGTSYNFAASGTHKVILNGTGLQTVSFESTASYFNILDLHRTPTSEYRFSRVPCWKTLLDYGEPHEHDLQGAVTAPTCTEGGFTSYSCYCGHAEVGDRTEALGHAEAADPAVAPTCENPGLTAGSHCARCGEILLAQEEVPALGHDHQKGVCTRCGDSILVASGWSGSTTWVLTQDGALTVYGTGNMKNYGYAGGQPWLNKGVDITTVVIEEGVTSVGSGAFMDLTTLESVVLPETLTKMGEAAFYGSGLTSVEIPASLWTIQPYTFKNCVNLAEVTFNEGNLQKISDGAFYGTGLTELVLPDCLGILDIYAFKGCDKLVSITIGAGLTELREAVFYGTAIPTIEIPEGITKIGPYAFKNCVALETVDFPSTLTAVGEASFYADTALKIVELPDSVTSIGNYAFRKCAAIEELALSAELVTIGECAFYGCTGLTELVIPDKVTTIKPYAFKTCEGLTSVTLGSSVKTIGEGAFNTCTGLKTIVFPASLESIGDYCFSGSYNLWKLTFEGDAPAIGTGAFKGLNATAYYPGDNATWTSAVMQNYGGKLTWKAN